MSDLRTKLAEMIAECEKATPGPALVETVARALWFAYYWPDRDSRDIEDYQHLWAAAGEADRACFFRMAREAIRFAEWARGFPPDTEGGRAPLTYPPTDWQAEK